MREQDPALSIPIAHLRGAITASGAGTRRVLRHLRWCPDQPSSEATPTVLGDLGSPSGWPRLDMISGRLPMTAPRTALGPDRGRCRSRRRLNMISTSGSATEPRRRQCPVTPVPGVNETPRRTSAKPAVRSVLNFSVSDGVIVAMASVITTSLAPSIFFGSRARRDCLLPPPLMPQAPPAAWRPPPRARWRRGAEHRPSADWQRRVPGRQYQPGADIYAGGLGVSADVAARACGMSGGGSKPYRPRAHA